MRQWFELLQSIQASPLEILFWIVIAVGAILFFRAGLRNIKRR